MSTKRSSKKNSRTQSQSPAGVQAALAAAPAPAPSPAPDPQPKKKKAKPSAFADTLREWESLLDAVEEHSAELGSVEPYRAALADSLDKVKTVKGVQELHDANRQASTRDLGEAVFEGKDRVIRLRGAIQAVLGPTTERLTQFGIRPRRRRQLAPQAASPAVPMPEIVAKKV